jgi:preprotein translocase subunit SecG
VAGAAASDSDSDSAGAGAAVGGAAGVQAAKMSQIRAKMTKILLSMFFLLFELQLNIYIITTGGDEDTNEKGGRLSWRLRF